jgi:hypothetical protein
VAVLTSIMAAIIALFAAVIVALLARSLKISEFRQAWINDQRKDVADYLGVTQRWFKAWSSGEEEWKLFSMGNEASVIFYRIKMRINPNENKYKVEDESFLEALAKLRMPYTLSKQDAESYWSKAAEEIVEQSRLLFKREWEATKRRMVWW